MVGLDGIVFDDGIYIYTNKVMTVRIFTDVLLHLYNHCEFDEYEATASVLYFHKDNGGRQSSEYGIYTFKKCKEAYLNNSISYMGNRQYALHCDWAGISYTDTGDYINGIDAQYELSKDFCDRIVGEGIGAVYVYYYDTYKEHAENRNNDKWACKVGMTQGDAVMRVYSQAKTSCAETPHIGLIIRTNEPVKLEQALHKLLRNSGSQIQDSMGKEWFKTTPEIIYMGCIVEYASSNISMVVMDKINFMGRNGK